jgi:hypothetical protein
MSVFACKQVRSRLYLARALAFDRMVFLGAFRARLNVLPCVGVPLNAPCYMQSLPQLRRQSNTIMDSSRALGQTMALLPTATLRRELPVNHFSLLRLLP